MKTRSLFLLLLAITSLLPGCARMTKKEALRYASARALYADSKFDAAASSLKGAYSPPSLTLRGKALYFAGKLTSAKRALRLSLFLSPASTESALFLARIEREGGHIKKAQKLVTKILANDSQNLRAMRLAASLAEDEKNEEAASLWLDKTLAASEEACFAYLERGRLRWRAGNKTGALSDIRGAKALTPEGSPLYNAAQSLETSIERALKTAESAAAKNAGKGTIEGTIEENLQ